MSGKRPMRLEIYRDTATLIDPYDEHVTLLHQWRWRIRATNGRILAPSGEAYQRLRDCAHGAGLVTGFDGSSGPVLTAVARPGSDFTWHRDNMTGERNAWRITVES